MSQRLPEYTKPHVEKPLIEKLDQIAPSVVTELSTRIEQGFPQVQADSIVGLSMKLIGGVSTQTPGAVSTVNIPHGLEVAPSGFSAQAADANARGAPAFYLTVNEANIVLHFAANLAAATAYSWAWTAIL